ncbi:uncharacterized protein LOC120278491 [Dioscorea cayenensis subsp. rotundata]|uniref:Uncharacterized protein LOC120278491 n=1 Tax=Dioscorea cayennensis subsp. rotundata TaxID=55577 RepID=A0AB40CT19_DIOCR|nr:uncharacterized protein LOC120278491 [Dioscorea cayenensis subsp. rotundata]
MTLQLADCSVRHPRGIIEDVLIKVGKYNFLADFVVLNVDEDMEVLLSFGRSLLHTFKAFIDMDGGKMTLCIGEEKIIYRLAEAIKHSLDFDDIYYFLDVTNESTNEYSQEFLYPDPYENWSYIEKEEMSKHEE